MSPNAHHDSGLTNISTKRITRGSERGLKAMKNDAKNEERGWFDNLFERLQAKLSLIADTAFRKRDSIDATALPMSMIEPSSTALATRSGTSSPSLSFKSASSELTHSPEHEIASISNMEAQSARSTSPGTKVAHYPEQEVALISTRAAEAVKSVPPASTPTFVFNKEFIDSRLKILEKESKFESIIKESFDIPEDNFEHFILQLKEGDIKDDPFLLLHHKSLRDYMSHDSSENELAFYIFTSLLSIKMAARLRLELRNS
ncbi:uncharacterized protein PHALS_10096 [Plasmopara halstedii]|uniref:Uncharacterized protein n=1 Tax=Plasmopara halstedii TaxID=4781 RepID=A0A0P1AFU5_PLAHL|nr:uncharacterized protein PHALS_10096 [Plasmopara halstedii]CEG39865.1 hypothetical protein PHALS_10096 [Plasmopara halstedii]|eukprot:XP_024576234.1 hypothetical protein PHALS_10096 [Plasmopara halstedii]